MSIVERSSDNDYSSSNSSSSAGENLDEFIKHNVQAEEVQGYPFQRTSYNRKAQISEGSNGKSRRRRGSCSTG